MKKQERDLKKAIQDEDDMIWDEEEKDISAELDELTDEAKKGNKMKSYWNENNTERGISSSSLDETAQKRVEVLQKIHSPVGLQDLWSWPGPPS